MDTTKIFEGFLNEVRKAFPDVSPVPKFEDDLKTIETYYPDALKILQRDDTFFTEKARTLFGVDLTALWKRECPKEELWKHFQMCMIGGFLHGDIKDKIGSIIEIFKSYWTGTGNQSDEVNKILNDKNSEDHFKSILEFIMNTRIAKLFTNIIEQIDPSEFNLNIESPEQLMEMVRDPENPVVKKLVNKIQNLLKGKMQRGEITQQQITAEVEAIKAKVTSLFGDMFNDALGLNKGDTPAAVLVGNSPEARRQRMLARLQKKQRDKNSS
uniref:Uncharacterized protein n=1 Tax=viral metagenome TaxID=1070528 RepID=A0A6C0CHS8_9ZZZZ